MMPLSLTILLCRALLALYPQRTRRRFGDELHDIYVALLRDAHARGGNAGLLRLLPRLAGDLVSALVTEYLDVLRDARLHPNRIAAACLVAAGLVWTLILAASAGDVRWAAAALDFNLALTMSLAFGLPLAALAATRLRAASMAEAHQRGALPPLSAGATFATWTLLVCHLA